ncbi:MAG: carbon-phosphorus lyase complex subunit PhnI [Clostridium sp.]
MGYVAVKGGTIAIDESIKRLKYERIKSGYSLNVKEVRNGMRGLIDQIMSEASLYCEDLASLAIKQCEGNVEECIFLLRAYRSTLPRKHYSSITETNTMRVERRISASFKDILGGQILGASYDYTHRLLDFTLEKETAHDAEMWLNKYNREYESDLESADLSSLPKVVEYLRKEGLIEDVEKCNIIPKDITKENLEFPSKRSERLQSLTRGQTGAVTSLAYSALRGYGITHPTVGELRVGKLQITIEDPSLGFEDSENDYYIGEIKVTEVETFIPVPVNKENIETKDKINFELGYGLCYGQNETKAIAMSILDYCLENKNKRFPTGNEEFVLLSIDSVESTGFISHLKLPHYVTFQSELHSVRKTHKEEVDYES